MNLPALPIRDLLAIRHSLALAHLELRCLRLSNALKRYNPDQPRVPAGQPGGGQWAGEGTGEDTVSPDASLTPAASRDDDRTPLKIDLQEEEERGGHAIREHVGKSDAELVGRLEREYWNFRIIETGRLRAGTFFSLAEANDYVNKALEANPTVVEEVASGRSVDAFITYRFGFVTGREAIVDPEQRKIDLRRTYGVGVLIYHDKRSRNGFRVHTAYPRNNDQQEAAMEFPEEFKQLAFDTLCAHLFEIKSEDEFRQYLMKKFTPEKRQRLGSYLTELLDGRYSDKEINALWRKTGTDVGFFRPEAARAFLLKVRDWLAQGNPS